MDLEERLREAAKALHAGDVAPMLSQRFTFNVDGRKGDAAAALAWISTVPVADVTARVVGVKRNLLFVDWSWPAVGVGVAVLSWDQDGRLADALVQRRVGPKPAAGPAA